MPRSYLKQVYEIGFGDPERRQMFRMMMRLLDADLAFVAFDDRGGSGAIKLVVDEDNLGAKRLPRTKGNSWIKRDAYSSVYT